MRAFERYLTEEEQRELLRFMHLRRADALARRDGALMRLLLHTGMRLGETLGLTLVEEESSHDLLQGPGIEIVIHGIPRQYAMAIGIAEPPVLREASAMKPVFVVDDLARVRAAAEAAGGGLKPLAGAWQIRGATVLDGHDPEGYVLSTPAPRTAPAARQSGRPRSRPAPAPRPRSRRTA